MKVHVHVHVHVHTLVLLSSCTAEHLIKSIKDSKLRVSEKSKASLTLKIEASFFCDMIASK